MTSDVYRFRPDVFRAVTEAVPLICPAKKDVVAFFRGAGLRHSRLDALAAEVRANREALRKHDMVHELLIVANEDPSNDGLRVQREILKRIVDFNNFEACWPKDQLAAKGAVAKVRELVAEKDAFTRMAQAHDNERAARIKEQAKKVEEARKSKEERDSVKSALYAAIVMPPGRARGDTFEAVLNRVFALDGLLIRESFHLAEDGIGIVEQIDGVMELDNHLYLVEAKFWSENLGVGDVAQHMVRVASRSEMRGLYVVHPGFSEAAIRSVADALQRGVFILGTVEELVHVFEADGSISEWLRAKLRHAMIDKDPHRLVTLK
jgi:hypothetical protein